MHEFAELFGAQGELELEEAYNVAPTQQVLAVREASPGQRRLDMLRWGLVPFWSKGPDSRYSMINARAETLAKKPAYRAAFKVRRCLIAANGFYEWQRSVDGKQPFFIGLPDGGALAMAGLWERWEGGGEPPLESCVIVTTEANDSLSQIHDRMPLILPPESYATWLDSGSKVGELARLLRPYSATELLAYAVSDHVNKVVNDDAACMRRLVQD